jgi:exonuclease III
VSGCARIRKRGASWLDVLPYPLRFSEIQPAVFAYNGVAILTRGRDPVETHRGLPGDPQDLHSRYIEARVDDLTVGCLYLPNGNPAPGPKFDYKLRLD